MLRKFILQIISGVVGIWLAARYVPGVEFIGSFEILLLIGLALGLLNFFIKPTLNLITLPLRLLSFGLFSIVINMLMLWIVDIIFPELIIVGLIPLFWTTLITSGLGLIINR